MTAVILNFPFQLSLQSSLPPPLCQPPPMQGPAPHHLVSRIKFVCQLLIGSEKVDAFYWLRIFCYLMMHRAFHFNSLFQCPRAITTAILSKICVSGPRLWMTSLTGQGDKDPLDLSLLDPPVITPREQVRVRCTCTFSFYILCQYHSLICGYFTVIFISYINKY